MKKKLIYAGSIAAVVLAAVVVWSTLGGENNTNFPEGTDWLCTNKGCATHFKMTIAELGEHHKQNYGKPVPCPECKQVAQRASVCGECKTVFIQVRGLPFCPKCKKPLAPSA